MSRKNIDQPSVPSKDLGNNISSTRDFSMAGKKREKDFQKAQLDQETEFEKLSHEWDHLLSLFGDDAARERFANLCRDYVKEYYEAENKSKVLKSTKKSEAPDEGRSILHNRVMETLRRLICAREWPSKDRTLLEKMQDRDNVAEMIRRNVA